MKTIREMAYEAGFAGTASVFYMCRERLQWLWQDGAVLAV